MAVLRKSIKGVEVREVNDHEVLRTGVDSAEFTARDALGAFTTARENLLAAADQAFAVADEAQEKAQALYDLSYEAYSRGEEFQRQAEKIAEALGLPVAEAQTETLAEWEQELLNLGSDA